MRKIHIITAALVSVSLFFFPLFAQQKATFTDEAKLLVYSTVLQALADIAGLEARDIFIKGLKSREYFIRQQAVSILGSLNDKEAAPLLKELVDDENFGVKMSAINALIGFGETNLEEELLGFLSNSNASIRSAAAASLGGLGDKYFKKLYEILLKENNPVVRSTILGILGAGKFEPAKENILTALNDANVSVRQTATSLLGQMDDKEAIPLLLKKLEDSDASVRATAKEILSGKGEESIIELCWQDIEDKDPLLRKSSFIALANLKDIDILPVLLKEIVAGDTPMLLRSAAASALMILKPHLEELINKGLLASKTELLSLENLGVNYKADGKDLGLIFTEALKDKKSPLRQDAPFVLLALEQRQALGVLRELLFDDDPNMIAASARCLGVFRDKDSESNLIKLARIYGL
ncbi:MAG: HEAT repeat domain-containing protein [Candidatus Omnitrophota bacterium]